MEKSKQRVWLAILIVAIIALYYLPLLSAVNWRALYAKETDHRPDVTVVSVEAGSLNDFRSSNFENLGYIYAWKDTEHYAFASWQGILSHNVIGQHDDDLASLHFGNTTSDASCLEWSPNANLLLIAAEGNTYREDVPAIVRDVAHNLNIEIPGGKRNYCEEYKWLPDGRSFVGKSDTAESVQLKKFNMVRSKIEPAEHIEIAVPKNIVQRSLLGTDLDGKAVVCLIPKAASQVTIVHSDRLKYPMSKDVQRQVAAPYGNFSECVLSPSGRTLLWASAHNSATRRLIELTITDIDGKNARNVGCRVESDGRLDVALDILPSSASENLSLRWLPDESGFSMAMAGHVYIKKLPGTPPQHR